MGCILYLWQKLWRYWRNYLDAAIHKCTNTNAQTRRVHRHECTQMHRQSEWQKFYEELYKVQVHTWTKKIYICHTYSWEIFFWLLLIYLILLLHNANLTAMCIICIIYPEHLWIRKMINNQPDIIHDIQEVFFHFFLRHVHACLLSTVDINATWGEGALWTLSSSHAIGFINNMDCWNYEIWGLYLAWL